MAEVGGMDASVVIKLVIEQIGSAIGGKIKLQKNLTKDLQKMKMALESVEAVLSNVKRQSIMDNSAHLWLKRLKDALYDISNMLDDFEADTDLLAVMTKKIKMLHKMKEMQERLQKIAEDLNNYHVLPETRRDGQHDQTRVMEEEAYIIGRTEEKQKMLSCLCWSTTKEITFLLIWGIEGIGKTTMARLLYFDPQFKEYSRVWVYVSQIFDLKKICNIIISQLSENYEQSKIEDMYSLHTRLRELLTGKKILIILDDLWEKHHFQLECLEAMLKLGEGSKVMVVVTTRDESIAQKIGTVDPYNLGFLTDEMCWDIIKKKTNFEARSDKERLEPIGMEIAAKCRGVALAAQSVGCMLKSMRYEGWDSVRSNHISNLSTSEATSPTAGVFASLLLSYKLMPSFLKLCFAYCAIFPKGHVMIKDDLIHQWIALEFLDQSSTVSTWNLGESCVRQLLRISFLQHPKNMDHDSAILLTMDDLVHDFAKRVMADEVNIESPLCRYACVTDSMKRLGLLVNSPTNIRALHFLGLGIFQLPGDAFSQAKYLRVLNLSMIQKLPDSIGLLNQLRYLNAPNIQDTMIPTFITKLSKLNFLILRGSSRLSALPESIGEMLGLIHLDLSYCSNIKELPISFAELRELRHLDLSCCAAVLEIPKVLGGLTKLQHLNLSKFSLQENSVLSHCKSLRRLPEVIGNLTELRYLNLSACMDYIFDSPSIDQTKSFIDHICALPYMEDLDLSWNKPYPLRIPESASSLKKLDLKGCSQVVSLPNDCVSRNNLVWFKHANPDELKIDSLENLKSSEGARSIRLSEKEGIGELTLEWTKDVERFVEDQELLTELVPPTTLKAFEITGYRSASFPDWLMDISDYLPNLVSMKMTYLPKCNSLPVLVQLPCLQKLVLSGMESLEEWNTTYSSVKDGVNDLERLYIYDCPKLRIKPHPPRAASWKISGSDKVLTSWEECVLHTGASSSSSPVTTKLEVENSKVPLHQWRLLHHLPLRDLTIINCSDLTSSWEIIGVLSSLRSLTVNHNQVELLEWLGELTSLEQLEINDCPKLKELHENMGQLTQLQSFRLYSCGRVRALPQRLGDLTSLRKLEIHNCMAIRTLPGSIQQLTNLQELRIHGRPELKQWCESKRNRMKLAHINLKSINIL